MNKTDYSEDKVGLVLIYGGFDYKVDDVAYIADGNCDDDIAGWGDDDNLWIFNILFNLLNSA